MTTKLFALTFSIVLLLSQPLFLLGQDTRQADWAAVQSLSQGAKLLIETKDGKRIKGRLTTASATTLGITRGNGTSSLNKDDIRRIYQLSGGSRAKSLIIGTAAGAGVGAGVGAIALGSTGGSDDAAGILILGTLLGAGVGAVLGALAGKSERRLLIYESR
jgi:hypothetical protein